MTHCENRVQKIRARLTEAFSPFELEVIDESAHHLGHAGAKSGLGHFAISICSQAFAEKNALERHRLIYEALGDMMLTDIHALRILSITTPPLSDQSKD